MRNRRKQEKPELSGLELELMQEIWTLDSATAAEVKAKLKRDLADTTIHTVLSNLQKKGYIELIPTTERSKRYRPTIERQKVAERSLRKLVRTLFQGSPAEAMLQLMKSEQIDEKDLAEIKKLIEEKVQRGGELS